MSEPDQSVQWHKRVWRWCVAHPYHLIGIAVLVIVGVNVLGVTLYPSKVAYWRRAHRMGTYRHKSVQQFFFICHELRYYLLVGCGIIAGLVALSRHRGRDS